MIRRAEIEDAEILTELSFSSKRYWQYPESFFDVWRSELTITKNYISRNDVYVFESREQIVGYYSLVTFDEDLEITGIRITKGTWLEHMFVLPDYIGRLVGSRMFAHLRLMCLKNEVEVLHVLVDPKARGFYEKMGCTYDREFPSTIAGRTTPLFTLKL